MTTTQTTVKNEAKTKQACKQCMKQGKTSEFESKSTLEEHLNKAHGLTLNKELHRQAGVYFLFMDAPCLVYIRGREQPIHCTIKKVETFDLLVKGEHGDALIPKHAIDLLEYDKVPKKLDKQAVKESPPGLKEIFQ